MHAVEKQMNICHSQLENKVNQNTGVTPKAFAKIMLPHNLEGLNQGIKVVDHCLFSNLYSFGGIRILNSWFQHNHNIKKH